MKKYISVQDAKQEVARFSGYLDDDMIYRICHGLSKLPSADVVEEEDMLKFYYVASLDDYWIGRRSGDFYYATYDRLARQWTWKYSRNLPWGYTVIGDNVGWTRCDYPSEPEEIPFTDWLEGFMRKERQEARSEGRYGNMVPCKECIKFNTCLKTGGQVKLLDIVAGCENGVRKEK